MTTEYKTSRAIVMERPRDVSLRDIELTQLNPDSYVVRTMMSGISSGTDMKTWRGEQAPEKLYYPCVPGYENVGTVVYAGPEAKEFKEGDRVTIYECREFGNLCAAWGGNSEYVVKDSKTAPSPFDYMTKLPDNVSYKDGVLAYLATVALKGIGQLNLSAGDFVTVIGAGMVGTSALQILKILCPELQTICIERNKFRQEIAAKYADYVIPAGDSAKDELMRITKNKGTDTLIECSGNTEVVGSLYKYLKDGGWNNDSAGHIHLQGDYPGRIVFDDYSNWFVKNCKITMTCAAAPGGKEQIVKWISEGQFDTSGLPVEIWPVEKCAEAYRYKQEKGDDVFKVIFDWNNA